MKVLLVSTRVLEFIFLLIFILSVVYLFQGLFTDILSIEDYLNFNLFVLVFSFFSFLLFLNISIFFRKYIQKAKIIDGNFEKDEINLADFLSVESASRTRKAIRFAKRKKVEVNSSILLYFLLNQNNIKITFILNRILISRKELLSKLKDSLLTTKDIYEGTGLTYSLDDIMLEAAKATIRRKGEHIKTNDIFSALSKIEPHLKEELRRRKLKKEDIDNLNFWQENLFKKISNGKRWWDRENLSKLGSVAKDWASGFTPTLDCYSSDLTEMVRRSGFIEIIGHEKEINQAERVLTRDRENNVLLVGDNGVGRLSIVRSITQRSYLNKSLPELNGKRFVELNMSSILTKASSTDEIEIILDQCFREASYASNVILVLSDFDNYINDKMVAGSADISSLIAPYLRTNEFKFIAVTSYKGLHKYIEFKPQILSLFQKIDVGESSKDETILLLEREIPYIEYKYNIFVTYLSVLKIIELSEKYIQDSPFPKKAIMLLNDIAVYVSGLKEKVMLESHVEKIISEKTEIPVGNITSDERNVLLNLESLIHGKIINQVEAVNEVSSALRRSRSQMKTKTGPMGTFLFLGPTGVGKTETAKALAEVYFGSESKMIRFDMSEFQTDNDIKRFIGDEEDIGLLASKVTETPFSLVLFDEIEKSHPNILNLLLQILDEGFMTNSIGKKVNFQNTIIIATSNAGYQIILDTIKENKTMDLIRQEILDYVFKEGIFRPELINRFDATVIFKALTKENLLKIADLRFKKLQQNLLRKQILLEVSDKVKMEIVELSYNPQFGAREMRRVIQDKVENALAKSFLSGEINEGDTISIDEGFVINVIKKNYEE
ncbi:MAG: AAA family ATPase [Candidatus ainarchaeum sp.]|nr:AAA family ATPase [Candidatus ainarchaeum sp.]